MFLKSLVLRGFKTFADLTEIEFMEDARITAVVGPNGCGKSNLMDATRWVLGEDNPRDLRVAALSNIIFAGTANRKPLSVAEVALVFDNSSGKLPIPFTEVSIKRRTFREGESEFFINKTPCRLKDIKDLLLDTGLGEGTYSIITQGQVDAILSSKGEERRAVFEEAAGINKYKFRKVAAEKKLIAAEQNMLRISDLKIEVSERLITLEDQARRAQKYLAAREKVKELDIALSRRQLASFTEKKEKLTAELEQTKKAALEKQAAGEKDLTELTALKEAHRQLEIAIDEIFVTLDKEKDHLRDLELDRRFAESERERERKTLTELTTKAESLAEKIGAIKLSLEQKASHLDLAGDPLAALLEGLVAQVSQLVSSLSQLLLSLGKENSLTLSFGSSTEKEETDKLKLEMLEEEAARCAQEKERIEFGLRAHQSQIENLNVRLEEAKSKNVPLDLMATKKQERENLSRKIAELEDRIRSEDRLDREKLNAETNLEVALARLEGEVANVSERIALEYNLTLEEAAALPYDVVNPVKARKELEEGRETLRSLEPVNLLAIEEYEKEKERLSFIEAQLADLNSARENLRGLIVELDLRAEQTFVETMQKLSSVFSETFSKLFVGGEARIALSTDAPPLLASIEISVRPSGRKWHPLSMLSGGERSLSAIAILFSLLKIRPSPLCFLDEVDAALDDANIGRFAEILKDFCAHSQIIVITHNKRTMAAAANIYGVTMEEPGVSKVLSMKLAEVAK